MLSTALIAGCALSSPSSFPTAPSVAWSHLSGGGIESAAALTETQAFFASANEDTAQGTIFGLNRATGARDWVLPVESMCLASGAVGDGALFLGCDDKVLHALEQRTGAERWSHAAGGEFTGGAAFSAAQNLVISGSSKPSVVALDARSGAVAWEFETEANVASTPVLAACASTGREVLYVGDDGGSFFKLDAATGAKVWGVALGAGNVRCPANVLPAGGGGGGGGGDGGGGGGGELVLLSAGDPDAQPAHGSVLALRTADGSEAWRSECDGGPNKCSSCWTTPTVVDGVAVVGCGIDGEPSGKVWGLAPATGEVLWRQHFDNDMQTSSPLPLPDGKGFVLGNIDGHLHCLEGKTGARRWKWRTPGAKGIWSTPRLAVDDDTGATIYVSSHDKHVYALREEGGKAAAADDADDGVRENNDEL